MSFKNISLLATLYVWVLFQKSEFLSKKRWWKKGKKEWKKEGLEEEKKKGREHGRDTKYKSNNH